VRKASLVCDPQIARASGEKLPVEAGLLAVADLGAHASFFPTQLAPTLACLLYTHK
jgi:hypothetical protein